MIIAIVLLALTACILTAGSVWTVVLLDRGDK